MITFTPTEESLLRALPKKVQALMIQYPSVAENYLRCHALPLAPKGHQYKFFEIYYDCDELPILTIKEGIIHANDRPISDQPPQIIEMIGDDDIVFIQCGGHVILNLTNDNMPEIHSALVEVGG